MALYMRCCRFPRPHSKTPGRQVMKSVIMVKGCFSLVSANDQELGIFQGFYPVGGFGREMEHALPRDPVGDPFYVKKDAALEYEECRLPGGRVFGENRSLFQRDAQELKGIGTKNFVYL